MCANEMMTVSSTPTCTSSMSPTSTSQPQVTTQCDCIFHEGTPLFYVVSGAGCVITVLLIIILMMCVFIACLLGRGRRGHYSPTRAATTTGSEENQHQPRQQQNQGTTLQFYTVVSVHGHIHVHSQTLLQGLGFYYSIFHIYMQLGCCIKNYWFCY